jgi:hypothetical protein
MDKLEAAAREAIKKMSTDRLRMKLAKVGVDEDEIAGMLREQLMHAWAERVAEGREEPLPMATAPIKAPGYDVDLERQRLEATPRIRNEKIRRGDVQAEEGARREVSAGKKRERREFGAGRK